MWLLKFWVKFCFQNLAQFVFDMQRPTCHKWLPMMIFRVKKSHDRKDFRQVWYFLSHDVPKLWLVAKKTLTWPQQKSSSGTETTRRRERNISQTKQTVKTNRSRYTFASTFKCIAIKHYLDLHFHPASKARAEAHSELSTSTKKKDEVELYYTDWTWSRSLSLFSRSDRPLSQCVNDSLELKALLSTRKCCPHKWDHLALQDFFDLSFLSLNLYYWDLS